jgi:integrase
VQAQVAIKSFRRVAKHLSLPPQGLHDLRHLSGSLALHAGVPIALVSEYLGHADVSITLKVYTHAMARGEEVSNALQNLLTDSLTSSR